MNLMYFSTNTGLYDQKQHTSSNRPFKSFYSGIKTQAKYLVLICITLLFFQSCETNKSSDDDITKDDDQPVTSPYYGWFKDKTEFSFVTVSVTTGETNGINIVNTVTTYFYIKDGKEAIKEVSVMKMDGNVQPETQKILITSAGANYVINPVSKKYFKEAGDYDAVMYSKVWVWTRKRSDSYDGLSTNSSAQISNVKIGDIETTCYAISGVTFCFDAAKKLLKYEGTAGGMHTLITFSNYIDTGVSGFADECISKISSENYSQVADLYGL